MGNDELWLFKSYADEEDVEAVTEVIKRGTWWAKGPEVRSFEDRIAEWTGRQHALSFNSGTTALYGMLNAFGVTEGEVIVPSFSFPATANVVVAAGAEPVFADIEPDSLALDVESVADRVTDDTRAVMPIHFGGDITKDIRSIRDLCDEEGLFLFEDACHSLGATFDGDRVGSFGDAAALSFCFNKIITTGEGGMVVTDDREAMESLRRLRSHGQNEDGEYVSAGLNFRLSSMAAALGVSQTEKLGFIIERRRKMASYLNDRLEQLDEIQLPVFPEGRDSVYQLYNLRFEDAGVQPELATYLEERGIPSRVTYDPIHLTRLYRERMGYERGDLPVTERVSDRILTLPFHLGLDLDDLDRIASTVIAYFDEFD